MPSASSRLTGFTENLQNNNETKVFPKLTLRFLGVSLDQSLLKSVLMKRSLGTVQCLPGLAASCRSAADFPANDRNAKNKIPKK
jgi:hypothetical protein